jgi:type I restriction enzyme S subunit
VNPFYLHYALRLPSTLEQFRKWSTGSSYPAILDEDVAKTLIPVPSPEEQDRIAQALMAAFHERERAVQRADSAWRQTLDEIYVGLSGERVHVATEPETAPEPPPLTIAAIRQAIDALPSLDVDRNGNNNAQISLEDIGLVAAK